MIAPRSPMLLRYALGAAFVGSLMAILLVMAHDRIPDGPLLVVDQVARPALAAPPRNIRLTALLTGRSEGDVMVATDLLKTPPVEPQAGFRVLVAATAEGGSRIMVWRQTARNAIPTLVLDRIVERSAGQVEPDAAGHARGLAAILDRPVPARPVVATHPS